MLEFNGCYNYGDNVINVENWKQSKMLLHCNVRLLSRSAFIYFIYFKHVISSVLSETHSHSLYLHYMNYAQENLFQIIYQNQTNGDTVWCATQTWSSQRVNRKISEQLTAQWQHDIFIFSSQFVKNYLSLIMTSFSMVQREYSVLL